ncbi:MAG: molybdopterin-dependent oxidoreductase [Salinibacter sp.]|uniref:molybdopterin-dependent oxidoreductase n=1 Tax=Salinibacter sp. TaxID=2065818 RepID=UPI0035D50BFE
MSETRRTFLRHAGGALVGLTLAPLAACERNEVMTLQQGQSLPFKTPVPDFYVINGGREAVDGWPGVPDLSRSDWTLEVEGLVDRSLTLSYSDLTEAEDLPEVSLLKTMRCVSDPTPTVLPENLLYAGTAVWTGVPLRAVLQRAGIDREKTNRLRLYAEDGYNNNLPIGRVYGPDVKTGPILAYRMNGQVLPRDHGFPVRVVAPRLYGYKNVKWLARIEATDNDSVFGQYQNRLGFVDDADVRATSRVSDPLPGNEVPAGDVRVEGYALSGYAGVDRVDVAVDDGPFRPASIQSRESVAEANPDVQGTRQWQDRSSFEYPFAGVWALWSTTVTLSQGQRTIRVRTTDRAGNQQPPTDPDPNDGSNAIAEVEVTVT